MSRDREKFTEQVVPRSLRQLISEEPDEPGQPDQPEKTTKRRRRSRKVKVVRRKR